MHREDIEKVTAIDPAGCGCMECLTGEYIPYDHYDIDEVLDAVIEGVIDPKSNVGSSVIVYHSRGSVVSETCPFLIQNGDYLLLEPYAGIYNEENSTAINVSLVEDIEDDEEQEQVIRRILAGEASVNPTDTAYLVWYGFGSYKITSLPAYDEGTLRILWD